MRKTHSAQHPSINSGQRLLGRILILLFLTILAITACSPQPLATPIPPTITSAPTTDWLQVYFTDPANPRAKEYVGGPDEALAAAMYQARLSLDVAVYSLNLWSIRDALLAAHRRGVVVRIVMESDNMDSDEAQALIAAGIPPMDRHNRAPSIAVAKK
ncbi:MAG: hypothetical protein QMD04_14770, partial [Anaerolineales bacterium]|nr:hypothetical protein [Anaerolineales bacterium]